MEEKVIHSRLAQALEQGYGLDREAARLQAAGFLLRLPEQLWKNIEEWLDGQPLSEIRYGRYSIPMILAIRQDQDFLDACDAMADYIEDAAEGERRIWRTVR